MSDSSVFDPTRRTLIIVLQRCCPPSSSLLLLSPSTILLFSLVLFKFSLFRSHKTTAHTTTTTTTHQMPSASSFSHFLLVTLCLCVSLTLCAPKGVIVPFYVDPNAYPADWSLLKQSAQNNPNLQFIAAINLANGPGIIVIHHHNQKNNS